MRIILIDPNIINFAGHPIEFAKSLAEYASLKKWECIVVSNKRSVNQVRNEFSSNFLPVISYACFENLTSGKDKFLKDLDRIDHRLHFTNKDIIIFLTSYTNEISATGIYLKSLEENSRPHFYFLVHQLFPPEDNFLIASQEERKRYWLSRFKKECLDLSNGMYIFSTPSRKLQYTLEQTISKKVSVLPLPFGNNHTQKDKTNRFFDDFKKIAFLGDGRYEKGALLFLQAAAQLRNLNAKFFIQKAKLRGFPETELTAFESILDELQKRKAIHIIDDDLSQEMFYETIENLDVLILPYHPKSYDARVSGLLIQGLRMGKPAIVSSGTWLEKEVNKFNSCIVFQYNIENQAETINNLSRSIKRMLEDLEYYRRNAINTSHIYRETHSAEKFFEAIFQT